GAFVPWESLFQQWYLLASDASPHGERCRQLPEQLLKVLPEVRGLIPRLRQGWIDDGVYHADFNPAHFADDDDDLLPNFLELGHSMHPKSADSDSDGWSDFAEFSQQSLANSSASHPPQIVPDGLFGDWQAL